MTEADLVFMSEIESHKEKMAKVITEAGDIYYPLVKQKAD